MLKDKISKKQIFIKKNLCELKSTKQTLNANHASHQTQ